MAIFTFNHTYKMDCGVDTDKYPRTKVDVKPAPSSAKAPGAKTKTFSSTSTPGAGKSINKPNSGVGKNQNAVRVTSSYTSPEMRPCGSCNGQHTHAFYCEDYYKASIQTERVKIAIKMQTCFVTWTFAQKEHELSSTILPYVNGTKRKIKRNKEISSRL